MFTIGWQITNISSKMIVMPLYLFLLSNNIENDQMTVQLNSFIDSIESILLYSMVINGRPRVWRRSYIKKSKNNKIYYMIVFTPWVYHLLPYCTYQEYYFHLPHSLSHHMLYKLHLPPSLPRNHGYHGHKVCQQECPHLCCVWSQACLCLVNCFQYLNPDVLCSSR